MSENELYLDAAAICDHYEKIARLDFSRNSALVTLSSNLNVVDQIAKAAENALNQMAGINSEISDESKPSVDQEPSKEETKVQDTEVKSAQNSCEDVNVPFIGKNKELIAEGQIQGEIPSVAEGYGLFPSNWEEPKEVLDTLEDCYNCNLRADFKWQLKPLNLMNELNKLIDQLHGTIDDILTSLEPFDFLKGICDFKGKFNFVCAADWMALLMAWDGLLSSYFGQLVRLSLNWTFIIGPFIKWIIDSAGVMIDVVRRALSAPLDCLANFLKQAILLKNKAIDSYDSTVAFAETLPEYFKNSGWEDKYKAHNRLNVQKGELGAAGYIFGKEEGAFKFTGDGDGVFTGFDYSLNDTAEDYFKKKKAQRALERKQKKKQKLQYKIKDQESEVKSKTRNADIAIENLEKAFPYDSATEKELKFKERQIKSYGKMISDEQEKLERLESKKDSFGFLENILLHVNEAKAFINNLFANFLLSLKSLNTWVVGSLNFSVKLGGQILMVLDLIKMVNGIINISKAINKKGLDFDGLCSLAEEDPEAAKELMNRWFGGDTLISDTKKSVADAAEDIKQFEDKFCGGVDVNTFSGANPSGGSSGSSDPSDLDNIDATVNISDIVYDDE
jgi:hypothetical protein